MEPADLQLGEREDETFVNVTNPFELETEIETEFNNLVNDQEAKLEALFIEAQSVGRTHMQNLYDSLKTKYQTSLNEHIRSSQLALQEQRNKTELSNLKLKRLEELFEANNQSSVAFKEKLATFMGGIRRRHESHNTVLKCFGFWNQLSNKVKAERKLDELANRVNSNFVKSRVFSRFAYNLVARNYETEKKEYLQSFQHQKQEMVSKYENEIILLKKQLTFAEMSAVKEKGLRLRLEEDIRRMLLKNMTSMNVEAIVALKQPLLYEDDLEATTQEIYYLNQQLSQQDADDNNTRQQQTFNQNTLSFDISSQRQEQKENREINTMSSSGSSSGSNRTNSSNLDDMKLLFNSSGYGSEINPRSQIPMPTTFSNTSGGTRDNLSAPAAAFVMINNKVRTMKVDIQKQQQQSISQQQQSRRQKSTIK